MLILAATSALDRAGQLPRSFWVNVIMAVVGFVALVLLIRYAAGMNKLVLTLIVFLFVTVIGFQWIYERNEPKFLSPYVDKIAPFLPSKVDYNGRK